MRNKRNKILGYTVAEAVEKARPTDKSHRGTISLSLWSSIENGHNKNHDWETYDAIDRALEWPQGTAAGILKGRSEYVETEYVETENATQPAAAPAGDVLEPSELYLAAMDRQTEALNRVADGVEQNQRVLDQVSRVLGIEPQQWQRGGS